jgi:hypothetical protein
LTVTVISSTPSGFPTTRYEIAALRTGNRAATRALAHLKASGIVGIAFNRTFYEPAYCANTGELLRRLVDLNMCLQLQVKEDQLRSGVR